MAKSYLIFDNTVNKRGNLCPFACKAPQIGISKQKLNKNAVQTPKMNIFKFSFSVYTIYRNKQLVKFKEVVREMIPKKLKFVTWFALIVLILAFGLAGCGGSNNAPSGNTSPSGNTAPSGNTKPADSAKPKLVLAEANWDSFQFHNAVAQFILEKGYGYPTEIMSASSAITFESMVQGDIDIYMEVWTDNLYEIYFKALEEGTVLELSLNYGDSQQGLYVPTYVIKGDPARGIEPMAPDLEYLTDLPEYWEIFKDEEVPGKGRIYGSIPGWEVDKIVQEKVKNYGLDKYYTYFSPGSETALSTSIVAAYESKEPWLGYYWEPTWLIGQYDMTLLKDVPYDEALWTNGFMCEFKACPVTVAVSKKLETKAPEVVEFLKNYKTSSALTNEALAYMEESKADAAATAKWFLQTRTSLWEPWVPKDVADKVKAALK